MGRLAALGVAFEGLQIFAGSQNLRADSLCEAQARSFELAVRLAAMAPAPVRVLNLGGGFGIPYFPGDQRLDLAPIGAQLAAFCQRLPAEMPHAHIVLELGRYLVGEAGVYVARITDRKVSQGQVFLVTDGGLHHHLAASGNFGQVLRRNYPVALGTVHAGREEEQVSVVGPLCTPLDLLADKVLLPRAEVGELVVLFQSGAYGASSSPQAFLGHPAVAEVLV
jgi:diaminopimelate decarboxylase